jgi:hypothetical protein
LDAAIFETLRLFREIGISNEDIERAFGESPLYHLFVCLYEAAVSGVSLAEASDIEQRPKAGPECLVTLRDIISVGSSFNKDPHR